MSLNISNLLFQSIPCYFSLFLRINFCSNLLFQFSHSFPLFINCMLTFIYIQSHFLNLSITSVHQIRSFLFELIIFDLNFSCSLNLSSIFLLQSSNLSLSIIHLFLNHFAFWYLLMHIFQKLVWIFLFLF